MSTSRKHHSDPGRRPDRHTRPHPAAAPTHLTELGAEVIATRLRTLGHPLRLRLLVAVDRRPSGLGQLADELGVSPGAIRSHLAVLYRAGVVRRADDGDGDALYELADWTSLWLVEQLAYRVRLRAQEDAAEDQCADDEAEGSSSCR
jgi:DNA-binding transcriptional ArsR family regulator